MFPSAAARSRLVRLAAPWLVALAPWLPLAIAQGHDSAPSATDSAGAWAPRRVRYDAHAGLGWSGDLGIGGRADISIFDRARLYDSHDELSVSVGADATFFTFGGSNLVTVYPTVTVQWSLGATERLALFPELGLVGRIDRDGWDGIYPNVGLGGRYYVLDNLSVFLRLGWPIALSAGVTF
ncbi:MAG: hypothetical protein RL385_6106 [Pseudomonadota bacterium]|jgi:hypothetical protein